MTNRYVINSRQKLQRAGMQIKSLICQCQCLISFNSVITEYYYDQHIICLSDLIVSALSTELTHMSQLS